MRNIFLKAALLSLFLFSLFYISTSFNPAKAATCPTQCSQLTCPSWAHCATYSTGCVYCLSNCYSTPGNFCHTGSCPSYSSPAGSCGNGEACCHPNPSPSVSPSPSGSAPPGGGGTPPPQPTPTPPCITSGACSSSITPACCYDQGYYCDVSAGQTQGTCQLTQGAESFSPPSFCPGGICNTALGPIGITPVSFIQSLFMYLLGIAGIIALILIIVAGYRLMTSQGNPEEVQNARNQLTAAVVGLLFVIFAFLILQVIGFSILNIF